MGKKILFLLLITGALTPLVANAQVTQEWVARYNGPGNGIDEAYSLAVDGSGNVYVTGWSTGSGTSRDYATIKYNSAGVQQWVQRYNGPANNDDGALSLAVDGSGNVYVTGYSTGSGTARDYATIKYNSAGVQQWEARYNGPGNTTDEAYSIAVDGSGNVYVTGNSYGSGTVFDYATIKYNSSGVQQWASRYNGPGNGSDGAYSLAVDGSGNVYVTGFSTGSGTGNDYVTIKYNSSGDSLWVRRYIGPGNGSDIARSLTVDGSGNVYVTGESGIFPNLDYATIKYNSSGDSLWVRRYNGPGNAQDYAYSLAVDGSGNVYVTGESRGSGTERDYATLKYNSSGVQQWEARFNGSGNSSDGAYSLAVDGSGNVYVTGYSWDPNETGADYCTIKYNSSGVQQWVQIYIGPGKIDDYAYSLAVDGSGNVYVTGGSEASGTNDDYATIKYSQLVGITPVSNEIPNQFSLSQNYPNPFNPNSKIKFQITKLSDTKLTVFDILGREVKTLVNEKLNPGTYEVDFDGSNLSSGIYYYKLTTGDFTETKKMILMK